MPDLLDLLGIQRSPDDRQNEVIVYELSSGIYDFGNESVTINFPLVLKCKNPESRPIIKCSCILVKNQVTFSGLIFHGSITFQKSNICSINNCIFSEPDQSCGACICCDQSKLKIICSYFQNGNPESKCVCICVDNTSSLILSKSHIRNFSQSLILISNGSNAIISNCELENSLKNGIHITNKSIAFLFHNVFHDISSSAFFSCHSYAFLDSNEFYNIKQNGANFSHSKCISIKNNKFHDIKSSAISLCGVQSAIIENNHFSKIGGNSLYIYHSSSIDFFNNTITSIFLPAVLILLQSQASIHGNKINEINRSGIYVRHASKTLIYDNEIGKCKECGISVSNTTVSLFNNNFLHCLAGIESYNNSTVNAWNNTLNDVKIGFSSYAGGTIKAKDNIVQNTPQLSLVRFCGSMFLSSSKLSNVQTLMCGNTSGDLFYQDNGGFPNSTNIPKEKLESTVFKAYLGFKCYKPFIILTLPFYDSTFVQVMCQDNFNFNEAFQNFEKMFFSHILLDHQKSLCEEEMENEEDLEEEEVLDSEEIINKMSRTVFCKLDREVHGLNGKCLQCGNSADCFLIPCGHRIYCEQCAQEAIAANKECPLCRFKIFSETKVFNSKEECIICRTNHSDSIVLPCGHACFCSKCLEHWFAENSNCPFCRVENAFFHKIITNI